MSTCTSRTGYWPLVLAIGQQDRLLYMSVFVVAGSIDKSSNWNYPAIWPWNGKLVQNVRGAWVVLRNSSKKPACAVS